METSKRKSKKTKGLPKAITVLLFILGGLTLLLLAMGGTILVQQSLRPAKATPRPTAIPTDTPGPTPLPNRSYDADRHPAFAPDLDKLGLSAEEIENDGAESFAAENWLDITPPELQSAADASVIRHIGLGYSYLVLDGDYYRLGEGDDGKGVLDVILCDLNYDGEGDVLYTYHFGHGDGTQAKVGWFDLAARTGVLSPFGTAGDYLALNEEDGAYILYRCERAVDENGGFALTFTDRLGEVIEQNGGLFLLLH